MSFSTSSFTNRRQIWSNQYQLRKQRSLIDTKRFLTNNTNSNNINNNDNKKNILNNSEHTKYSVLKKQLSVDQVYTKSLQKDNTNSINNNDSNKTILIKKTNFCSAQLSVVNNCNVNDRNSDLNSKLSTSSNLSSSSSTFKKRSIIKGYGENKKDKTFLGERLRRSSKTSEDRINLNIFLAQGLNRIDNDDCISSDLDESQAESYDILTTIENSSKTKEKSPIILTKPPSSNKPQQTTTAALRRAQFKASYNRQITTTIHSAQSSTSSSSSSSSRTVNITAAPSLTIERHPPLIRAMSAPVRTLDENSKNIIANKRKTRRRRIIGRNTNNINVIERNYDDNNENDENFNDRSRNKNNTNNKKSLTRARSAITCEVVTLVSLISSEGSDSEKEENIPTPPVTIPTIKRAPFLRKSGKSVSFQEHDTGNFSKPSKDFPHILRRGSITPLAARIRANRPPTAPPSSIFITDFENSESKMSLQTKSSSKEDISTLSETNLKENTANNCEEIMNCNEFPEYVRSIKERECWKLFQKMSNKGISVSYDTILRGMLTPTELRVIQKQNETEEARKAKEHEDAAAHAAQLELKKRKDMKKVN